MKIVIEMENLNKIIEESIAKNTGDTIEGYVEQKTKSILEDKYKENIDIQVNEAVKNAILHYLETFQITVGNPFNNEELRTFTPREYINHTISDIFEKKILTEKVKDRWSGREELKSISFEQYLKQNFDVEAIIKKHMETFASNLRRDINNILEKEYNKATREALSDVVMDTIMENEKFKKVSDGIRRLGE